MEFDQPLKIFPGELSFWRLNILKISPPAEQGLLNLVSDVYLTHMAPSTEKDLSYSEVSDGEFSISNRDKEHHFIFSTVVL